MRLLVPMARAEYVGSGRVGFPTFRGLHWLTLEVRLSLTLFFLKLSQILQDYSESCGEHRTVSTFLKFVLNYELWSCIV